MFARFNSQPIQLLSYLVLALVTIGPTGNARSEEAGKPPPLSTPRNDNNSDLCGWVDLETDHRAATSCTAINIGGSMNASVALVASAMCTSAGVSVEQIVEPFAMVGPALDNSLDAVKQFQRWWQHSSVNTAPSVTIGGIETDLSFFDLNRLLDNRPQIYPRTDPQDSRSFGVSILVRELKSLPPDPVSLNIHPPRTHILAGCSPMIFTIEESYMAYDMSDRDVQVWCVYPTTTRPFCIRSHSNEFDSAPMWDAFDQVVEVEPVSASDSLATQLQCSSYCMLDSVVRQVEDWVAEESAVRRICSPGNLGRELAAVMTMRQTIMDATAIHVAQSWRDTERGPSRAGAALLARAGAIETSSPFEEPMIEIAAVNLPEGMTDVRRR